MYALNTPAKIDRTVYSTHAHKKLALIYADVIREVPRIHLIYVVTG